MIVRNDNLMELAGQYLRCLPYLKPAIELAGTHDEMDVFSMLANKSAYLLALNQSAGDLEIIEYPKYSACRIWLAGGDLEELMQDYPKMEQFAIANKCKKIEILGRKGWERMKKDFENKAIFLVKEL